MTVLEGEIYHTTYPTANVHTAKSPQDLLGYRWCVVLISIMMKGRTVVCWKGHKYSTVSCKAQNLIKFQCTGSCKDKLSGKFHCRL